jgi:nucleoside-diphosphate-sugar epimerase
VKSILLLGASGRLGRSIDQALAASNVFYYKPSKEELDLSNSQAVIQYLEEFKTSTVIHSASNLTSRGRDESVMKRDAELTQIMDNNVIEACRIRSTKLLYISTSLIYGSPAPTKYLESDLDSSKICCGNRVHYASAKKIATIKIRDLNRDGLPFSSLVLPNLLAGPIPGRKRMDHLCERLINLVVQSYKENLNTIAFDIAQNPNLQMLSSKEVSHWITRNLDTQLPGIINMTSLYSISPSQLLLEIIAAMELDIQVIFNGIAVNDQSIWLSDTLGRTKYAWEGGLSAKISIADWISELRKDELL